MYWLLQNYMSVKVLDNFLNDEDIARLEKNAEAFELEQGGAAQGDTEEVYRSSDIKWLHANEDTRWLYEKLANFVVPANMSGFGKQLYFIEPLQYSIYNSEENGHYKAHYDDKDFMGGYRRKLSFTIQLSDEEDYEGGDLSIFCPEKRSVKKTKGTIALFDADLLHEVEPVTKGTRKALVGWFVGPNV